MHGRRCRASLVGACFVSKYCVPFQQEHPYCCFAVFSRESLRSAVFIQAIFPSILYIPESFAIKVFSLGELTCTRHAFRIRTLSLGGPHYRKKKGRPAGRLNGSGRPLFLKNLAGRLARQQCIWLPPSILGVY